jgi:hypothetical protein
MGGCYSKNLNRNFNEVKLVKETIVVGHNYGRKYKNSTSSLATTINIKDEVEHDEVEHDEVEHDEVEHNEVEHDKIHCK